MINPNNSKDRGRLFNSLERFFKALRPFRRTREKLIRDYAGPMYNENHKPEFQAIVNLMLQTADAYTLAMAANRPRFLLTVDNSSLRGFSKHFQTAINNLAIEIHLEETMQAVVLDAFFGPGIVKVLRADSPLIEIDQDVFIDPGSPYAERKSLDEFVYDTNASEWNKILVSADRYRVPFDALKDASLYNQKAVKTLQPTSKYQGDEDRTRRIASGIETDDDELEPMIDLMDVYLPREDMVVVWSCDQDFRGVDTKPLAVVDWETPESGPHHMLNLGPVPDNIMPTSPASNLKMLYDLLNSILRKTDRQARRQKDINIFRGDAETDAKRVKDAADGEWVKVTDPSAFQIIKQGGVDQANYAFALGSLDLFDRMAGNLSVMAGLGPQSDTASQDAMIQGQVSRREAQMQYKVVRFTEKIGRDLGHLLYYDESKYLRGSMEIPGTDISVSADWTPDYREGSFFDYNFKVEPYSMAYKSPSQRAGALRQITNELLNAYPLLAQQGIQFDAAAYLEELGELLDLPRLARIFPTGGVPQEPTQGEPPRQASHTVRENVRRNVPTGGTPESRRGVQIQQLLQGAGGGNSQANGDQLSAAGRY